MEEKSLVLKITEKGDQVTIDCGRHSKVIHKDDLGNLETELCVEVLSLYNHALGVNHPFKKLVEYDK